MMIHNQVTALAAIYSEAGRQEEAVSELAQATQALSA